MIIESLELLLGFKFNEDDVKNFDNAMKDLGATVGKLGAFVSASSASIFAMALSSSRSATDMLKLSASVGTAVENLEALEYVSAQNSVTTSTLTGIVEQVGKNIYDMGNGASMATDAFIGLGIAHKDENGNLRDSYTVTKEATEALSKMTDKTKQADYAQKLFGFSSKEVLKLVEKGSKAFTDGEIAMAKYGSSIPKAELEEISKLGKTYDTITTSMKSFTNMVWGKLAPAINVMLKQYLEWWALNREMITSSVIYYFKLFAGVILAIAKAFGFALKAIGWVVDKLGGLEFVLKVIATILAGLLVLKIFTFLKTFAVLLGTVGSAGMLMWAKIMLPALLMGVIIGALILIFQDLYTLFTSENKDDSFLGTFMTQEEVDTFKDNINSIIDLFKDTVEYWSTNGFLGGLAKAGEALLELTKQMLRDIKAWIGEMVDKIKAKAMEIKDAVIKPFKDAFEWIAKRYNNSYLKIAVDGAGNLWDNAKGLFGVEKKPLKRSGGGGGGGDSHKNYDHSKSLVTNNINITSVGDAKETADKVVQEINKAGA